MAHGYQHYGGTWLHLEFGHPRCVCNNEVKYNEGQKHNKIY